MKHSFYKKITGLFVAAVLSLSCITSFVPYTFAADSEYVPLAAIPETTVPCTDTTRGDCATLSSYLTGLFRISIAAAGILAFLMIVWGGFSYLSTDAVTGKEEGKERVIHALGGLILALAAYIILNTINPSLVELNLNFGTPTLQTTGLKAPSALTQEQEYTAQLDQTAKAILQNVDTTQATQKGIYAQAAALQDTLDSLYLDGVISDQEYATEAAKINAMNAHATAIGNYNAALDNFMLQQINGVNAAKTGDSAQQQSTLKNIENTATRDINKLNTAIQKDPANTATYTGWINSINQKADAAQVVIIRADIDNGNANLAKSAMDAAYKQKQAAIVAANGDREKIAAAEQRADIFIKNIQNQCALAKTLLSCRNYNPATGK